MSQTIKLKRSAVAGKVPTTSSLDLGEIALNTYDGKAYLKKNDGSESVQTLVVTDSTTTGSINISGNVSASAFSGSFFGNGTGLTRNMAVTGSDVFGNQFEDHVSVLHFDSDTGINVSASAPNTAFIKLGSHFRDFFVDGSATIVATGSDQMDIISNGGLDISTSLTDTNGNGVSKELIFAVDATVARTGSNTFTADQTIQGKVTSSTLDTSGNAIIRGDLDVIGDINVTGNVDGHITVSPVASDSNNSNGVVIQDLTFDGFGHTRTLGTVNLDDRYFTETEADNRFVNVTGDSISGSLIVSASGATDDFKVGDNKLFVSASGNVGVGTTSPAKLLTVGGSSSTSGIGNDGIFVNIDGGAAVTAKSGTSGVEIQLNAESNVQGTLGTYSNHPLAIRVNNANKMYFSTNGNVGIGTTSPSRKLDVNGEINIADSSAYRINNNRFVLYNGNTFLGDIDNAGGNVYIREDGANTVTLSGQNVGIGTTSPSERLVVAGNMSISGDIDLTAGQLELRGDVALDHDGSSLYVKAPSSIFFYPGNSNKANINSSGNFTLAGNLDINGTGTSTIDGNLTVGGIVTAQEFHTEFVSASIIYQSGSTKFGDTSDDVHSFSGSLRVTGSGDHYFTDGNVGIGTDSPSYPLTVKVDSATGIKVLHSNDSSVFQVDSFGSTGTDAGALLRMYNEAGDATVQIDTRSGGTRHTYFNNGGNVGIGTSSPSNKLHVDSNGSSNSVIRIDASDNRGASRYALDIIDSDSNSRGSVRISTTSGPSLTATGNVGIGTTSPAHKLDLSDSSTTWAAKILNTNANGQGLLVRSDTTNDDSILGVYGNGSYRMIVKGDGNVGIGNTSPQSKLHINSNDFVLLTVSGSNSSYTGALIANSGTGAASLYLDGSNGDLTGNDYAVIEQTNDKHLKIEAFASAGDIILRENGGETMRLQDGNVGIGTNSPDNRLVVADSNGAGLEIIPQTSNDRTTLLSYDRNASTYQTLDFDGSDIHFNVAGSEVARINSSGNVGIGTTSPTEKLEVTGNAILDASNANLKIKAGVTGTKGDIQWTFNTDSTVYASAGIEYNNRGTDGFLIDSGYPITMDFASSYIRWQNNGSEKMRLNTSGNLGIGTTSPSAKLHINSSVSDGIILRTTANVEPFIAIQRNSGTNGVAVLRSIDGGHLYVDTGATGAAQSTKMTIAAGGNVGIGTTSPSYALDIERTSGEVAIQLQARDNSSNSSLYFGDNADADVGSLIYNHGSNYMAFTTNASERMRIDSGGNVLVGKTASGIATAGGEIRANGLIIATRNDGRVLAVNRKTSDGTIIDLQKDSTTVGSIGSQGGDSLNIGSGDTGLLFSSANDAIHPWNISTNAARDNAVDLGRSSHRFKDLHLGGHAKIDTALTASGLIYPTSDGSVNQVIGTDGNGNLSFISPGAAAAFPYTGDAVITGSLIVSASGATNDFLVGNDKLFVSSNGNVGIGTASPEYRLDVRDSSTATRIVVRNDNNAAAGAGVYLRTFDSGTQVSVATLRTDNAGNLSIFTGTSSEAERMRIDSSGNVGIGTTSPSYELHVAGDIGIDNGDSIYVGNAASRISSNASADILYFPNRDHIFGSVIGGADVERMRITEAGNVGIGTTTPTTKLEIRKDSSDTTLTAITSTNDTISLLNETDTTNNYTSIGFVGNAAEITARIASVADASNGRGNLVFLTGDSSSGTPSERMRINSSGNVGIGITSPSNPLDVEGKIGVQRVGVPGTIATRELTGAGHTLNAPSGYHALIVNRGGSEYMRVAGDGNVGIGTTSPIGKLDVRKAQSTVAFTSPFLKLYPSTTTNTTGLTSITLGTSPVDNFGVSLSGWRYGTNGDPKFIIKMHNGSASGTDTLTVDSSGNVGIGTTNPSETLHLVSGRSDILTESTTAGQATRYRLKTTSREWRIGTHANQNDNLWFYDVDATAYRMAIDTNGNVGIGTTSPSTRLHVSNVSSNSQLTLERTGTATGKYAIYTNTNNLYINNVASSTFPFTILNNGNVGIGTTSPDNLLHVESTSSGTSPIITVENDNDIKLKLGTVRSGAGTAPNTSFIAYDADLRFLADADGVTEVVRFDSSGNVGIGTTSPPKELTVEGEISSSGGIYSEGAVQADTFRGDQYPTNSFLKFNDDQTFAANMTTLGAIGAMNFIIDTNDNDSESFTWWHGNIDVDSATQLMDLDENGNLTVTGIITAQEFHTEFVSASIIYQSGSTKFGDTSDDVHAFTGSLQQSGSDSYFLGNVSIGRTTSNHKLHVQNESAADTRLRVEGGEGTNTTAILDLTGRGLGNQYNNTSIRSIGQNANGGIMTFLTDNSAGNEIERMRIDSSGNVGIGTNSPDEIFHINRARSAGSDNFLLELQNPTTVADSRAGILFSTNANTGTSRDGAAIQAANNGVDGKAHITFGSVLNQTYSENIRFESGGNVGIGTTSPAEKLTVAGNISGSGKIEINDGTRGARLGTDSSGTGNRSFLVLDPDSADGIGIGSDYLFLAQDGQSKTVMQMPANSNFELNATTTNRLTILGSNGNVGIGTTSPSQKLHIVGGQVRLDSNTGGFYQYNTSGGFRSAFYDNGTVTSIFGDGDGSNPAITINSGNVGIGTTSPSTKLEVNGTATVTALVETSTRELKKDITELEDQSSIVDSLQPVSYTWKETEKEDFGLVAEDVADIAPHLVERDEEGNPSGIKYSKLSVLLLDVVQRQSTLIEDLNKRITKLENERGN